MLKSLGETRHLASTVPNVALPVEKVINWPCSYSNSPSALVKPMWVAVS